MLCCCWCAGLVISCLVVVMLFAGLLDVLLCWCDVVLLCCWFVGWLVCWFVVVLLCCCVVGVLLLLWCGCDGLVCCCVIVLL